MNARLFKNLFFALALLSGCDDGAEVGNPEVAVSARLDIRQEDSSASIPDMSLKVMGMSFTTQTGSGHLWVTSEGRMVNFAQAKSDLPVVTMKTDAWTGAELMLSLPDG